MGMMAPDRGDMSWQRRAACRNVGSSLFFAPDGEQESAERAEDAKRICNRCPVLFECRAHALKFPEPCGVWGGMITREREELRNRNIKHGAPVSSLDDGHDDAVISALIDGEKVENPSLVDVAWAAVRMWQAGTGFTRREIGRCLGVRPNRISHWVQRVHNGLPPVDPKYLGSLARREDRMARAGSS